MPIKDEHPDTPSTYDNPAFGRLKDTELRLAMERQRSAQSGDPVPPWGHAYDGPRLRQHGVGE